MAKAEDSHIRVYFMQRSNEGEEANAPVKIYRRLADEINFTYGTAGNANGHFTEYIANQSMEDERVECVFDGALSYLNSFSSYVDMNAEVGHIYLYWVTQTTGDSVVKIGPVACKLRDKEVWWNYERSVSEMKKLADDFPDLVTMKRYGESTRHRAIYGLKIGNPDRAILAAGAIHASEPGPELLSKALRFILEKEPELLRKVGLHVLPAVNVDVREETVEGEPFYLRKNPNGVDLNRNFDWLWREEFVYGFSNADPEATTYHGPYAASENETQAAMRFVRDCKEPLAMFVYDSSSVITEDWLLLGSNPTEACWERDNEIANLYSRAFRKNNPECGTFTAAPMHYPKEEMACFEGTGQPHGTFEGWVHAEYGIPSYSLQAAGSEETACKKTDSVPLELLNKWSRRHAYALIEMLREFSK